MITRAYARKEAEPRVKPKNASTKILGFGISMVGIVMLSIALIMGLEFPSFVHERVVQDICVTGQDHKFYRKWEVEQEKQDKSDDGEKTYSKQWQQLSWANVLKSLDAWIPRLEEDWVRYNKLYYWVVENPNEFLFHGLSPIFSERGPYIYRETRQKMNPIFDGPRVTFYNEINQTFEAALTRNECGKHCTENDELTVFNLEYLKQVTSMKTLDNVIYNRIPDVVKSILQNTSIIQTLQHNDLYAFLGCLNANCENQTIINYSGARFPFDISIGSLIQQNDTWYKRIVLQDRAGQSFSYKETEELYKLIQDQKILGVTRDKLTNEAKVIECKFFASKHLCNDSSYVSNFNDSNNEIQDFTTFHQSCGLIYILFAVADIGCLSNVTSELSQYINDVTGVVWFNVTSSYYANILESTIPQAYILLLKDFILAKVFNVVYKKIFIDGYPSIIQRKNQKQIALGYVNEGLFVDTNSTSTINRPIWQLSTCLENRNRDNNMVVREFNGSQFAPQMLISEDIQRTKYSGVTRYVPLAPYYVACETLYPQRQSYSVFVEDLYRDVSFSKPIETELYSTTLFKFSLDADAYSNSYSNDINCTIQMMSDLYKFPSWITNPYFYGCRNTNHYLINTNPSIEKLVSTVDIEPRTGKIWGKNIRLQTNTFLNTSYVNTRNLNPFNISSLDSLFPVYWIERTAQITLDESEYFKEKVSRLLDASCGGLAGFSVIAILTIIISAFVAILPHGLNKVAPAPVSEDAHAIHQSTII